MRWKTLFVRQLGCLVPVLALSVIPARAQSEASVRGQIVAAADRSALAQATVTLESAGGGLSVRAAPDASGRFVFSNISPGQYVLTGAAEGFSREELRIDLEPRETRSVTLTLKLRPLDVSVSVTGELLPLPSTHSPSSTILTHDRLDRLALLRRTTLVDAIATIAPGMIRGHDDFVHVRGEEVALNPLINGVAFWENAHTVFSGGLSPEIIDTANVMTGGFSAEYGNRFGGVIDIVTKSGSRMNHNGSLMLSGGEAGRWSGLGEFGGHRGRLGYYAFGSMFESDRFLSPPDPVALHDRARGGHAFLQVDGDLGRAGLLRATLMGDGANFEIPKTPTDVELRPLADAAQRTRQQSAIVGWSRAWSLFTVGASTYQRWSRAQLSPASGPLTAQGQLDRELVTLGGKVDITRFAGRHTIKTGIDLVRLRPREELTYNYAGYRSLAHLVGLPHIHIAGDVIGFDAAGSGGQVSAYVQDNFRIGDRLTIDAGVRLDRYDLLFSSTQASPRINAAFQAGGGAILHASYNRFFIPPPIEGVLSSAAGLTRHIREIGRALPPVQPTKEHQLEIGGSMPSGPLQLAVTGYYRTGDNPVHTTVWPNTRIYSYASFDRVRAYGLEAKADLPSLLRYGVSGYLNYALGRVYFYNPVTGGFVTEAEHLTDTNRFLAPMDQTHTLTAGASYRHASTGLFAATAVEYGSGTPRGHGADGHEHGAGEDDHDHGPPTSTASRVPGHVTADLSFGIDLLRRPLRGLRVSLQLDIENIANEVYLIAQESEFAAGQYANPRLISAALKVRF